MINAMFGAATALNAATAVSAVTANNIANSRTPSFKSNSTFLSELSNGGVKLNSIRPNNNQGSLIPTGVPSDVAVFGNGSNEDLLNTYSYAGLLLMILVTLEAQAESFYLQVQAVILGLIMKVTCIMAMSF